MISSATRYSNDTSRKSRSLFGRSGAIRVDRIMGVNATATLPMYDLAEVRRLTDDWWRGLTRHFEANGLNDVPPRASGENFESGIPFWLEP